MAGMQTGRADGKRDRGDLASEDQDLGILRGNFLLEGSEGGF